MAIGMAPEIKSGKRACVYWLADNNNKTKNIIYGVSWIGNAEKWAAPCAACKRRTVSVVRSAMLNPRHALIIEMEFGYFYNLSTCWDFAAIIAHKHIVRATNMCERCDGKWYVEERKTIAVTETAANGFGFGVAAVHPKWDKSKCRFRMRLSGAVGILLLRHVLVLLPLQTNTIMHDDADGIL